MGNSPHFTPGETVSLSVTATTGRIALGKPTGVNKQVRVASRQITALTDDTCFIKFGDATVTAATTDMMINAGTSEIFSVGAGITHIAAITAGSETAELRITSGYGD